MVKSAGFEFQFIFISEGSNPSLSYFDSTGNNCVINYYSLLFMKLERDKIYNYYSTEENRLRMENYINQDVAFTSERRYFHYYNDIPYTRWPFYISGFIFLFLFFGSCCLIAILFGNGSSLPSFFLLY